MKNVFPHPHFNTKLLILKCNAGCIEFFYCRSEIKIAAEDMIFIIPV